MKLFGLTGGIGMGKSTSGWLLAERGVSLVDTDAIARQLTEPGQAALEEIAEQFGRDIIGTDGRLRRNELARRVFGDVAARKELEGILHPRIRSIWEAAADKWRADGKLRGVVIIPLLFETDAAAVFDAVICVACSAASQRERLKARGWDEQQIDQRLEAQWHVAKKMELSNYVVWTEGGIDVHAAQLGRILA